MVTSSPVLARYDPTKPMFLKTDWSALGMAFILMQPASDEKSLAALKVLEETGVCEFDLSMTGARLQPLAFGSRACTPMESHFHSFVGEVASGCWAIAHNKKYLWGAYFYWICDCNTIKEVLDYQGTIHMINRWSQELLGYNFGCIHRSHTMMKDVDSLTRFYGSAIGTYISIADILSQKDKTLQPSAYLASTFPKQPTKIKLSDNSDMSSHLPLLATSA